jgi:hypothetical protein
MRPLQRLILPALLAFGTIGVSACDAINTASDTLGKAEACTKALQAAGFNPDLSNPDQAVADAQQRAQELRDVANQTTDADVKRELNETADQFSQLGPEDLTPTGSVAWTQRKLDQFNQLQAACTDAGGGGSY